MKKLGKVILILVILFCFYGVSFAGQFGAPTGKTGVVIVEFPPEVTYNLLTAVTAGTAGSAYDIGFTANTHTCVITLAGTAATTVVVDVYVGIDATTQTDVSAHTYTIATPAGQIWTVSQPGRYIRATFTSKTGGSTDTVLTLNCDSTK